MKFEDFNSVSTGIPGSYRFAPLEIVLRIEGLRRWLQVFIFGQGFEIIWSRKCHCLACRIDRKRKWFKKYFHVELSDEDLLNSPTLRKSKKAEWAEALTQHRVREALKNEKENTRS